VLDPLGELRPGVITVKEEGFSCFVVGVEGGRVASAFLLRFNCPAGLDDECRGGMVVTFLDLAVAAVSLLRGLGLFGAEWTLAVLADALLGGLIVSPTSSGMGEDCDLTVATRADFLDGSANATVRVRLHGEAFGPTTCPTGGTSAFRFRVLGVLDEGSFP
jgi:hypothetical protein